MSTILHAVINPAHIAGAVLATLTTIAGGTVFYDQAMPVVGNTIERVITPQVDAGGLLTIGYISNTIRQCPTDNIRIAIIDSQGVIYRIATDKMNVILLDTKEVGVTVTVPRQAGEGTALFNVSYDKVCPVLALWQSIHHVNLPSASFIVKGAL